MGGFFQITVSTPFQHPPKALLKRPFQHLFGPGVETVLLFQHHIPRFNVEPQALLPAHALRNSLKPRNIHRFAGVLCGCSQWSGNGSTSMVSKRSTMGHSLSTGTHSSLQSHFSMICGALWSALHAACNGRIIHFIARIGCECVTHGHRERTGDGWISLIEKKEKGIKFYSLIN